MAPMAQRENAFLKLGDIKGNATTKGFKKQIVLQSMSYGISQAGECEEDNRLPHRLFLLYSNRRPEDAPFL